MTNAEQKISNKILTVCLCVLLLSGTVAIVSHPMLPNAFAQSTETIDSTSAETTDSTTDTTTEPTTETTDSSADSTAETTDLTDSTYSIIAGILAEPTQPAVIELDESSDSQLLKEITVIPTETSEGTVTITTDIPEIASDGVQLFQHDGSSFNEITNNAAYSVQLVDTNDNQIPDQIVFEAPADQAQTFVVYAIILATSAAHLDSERNVISDVYDQIKERDGVFTGEIPADKRKKIWQSAEIIFSTPQCIANDLENYLYDLKEVSLIINDEAHRCIKNYDYTKVINFYKNQ